MATTATKERKQSNNNNNNSNKKNNNNNNSDSDNSNRVEDEARTCDKAHVVHDEEDPFSPSPFLYLLYTEKNIFPFVFKSFS